MNELDLLDDLIGSSKFPALLNAAAEVRERRRLLGGPDTLSDPIFQGRVLLIALMVRQQLYYRGITGSRLSPALTELRVWVLRQEVNLDGPIRPLL